MINVWTRCPRHCPNWKITHSQVLFIPHFFWTVHFHPQVNCNCRLPFFLHLSPTPNLTWRTTFGCGPPDIPYKKISHSQAVLQTPFLLDTMTVLPCYIHPSTLTLTVTVHEGWPLDKSPRHSPKKRSCSRALLAAISCLGHLPSTHMKAEHPSTLPLSTTLLMATLMVTWSFTFKPGHLGITLRKNISQPSFLSNP